MNIRYGISWTDVRRGKLTLCLGVALSALLALGTPAHAAPKKQTPASTTTAAPATAPVADTPTADDMAAGQSLAAVRAAIGADAIGATGAGVDVAVIDSGTVPVAGLNGTNKVYQGPDFSTESQGNRDLRNLDTFGHGTHIAGIIAGNDPQTGYQGIAPGSRIVNVKVANADGSTSPMALLAAVKWVVDNRHARGLNIRVINLSFGADPNADYTKDILVAATEYAWQQGVVVVVSAGNNGPDAHQLDSPAIDPFAISVGGEATNGNADPSDDTIADWSSSGNASRNPDLVAPGASLVSLRDPGSYLDANFPQGEVGTRFFKGSGTSQAAAVVSGAVADLLSKHPSLTPDQVKDLLTSTAAPIPGVDASEQGAGRIDLVAADAAAVDPDHAGQPWKWSPILLAYEDGTMVDPTTGQLTVEIVAPGGTTADGSRWSGSRWSGSRWSGSRWSGSRWSGSRWS